MRSVLPDIRIMFVFRNSVIDRNVHYCLYVYARQLKLKVEIVLMETTILP